jgi:hypothetical protein
MQKQKMLLCNAELVERELHRNAEAAGVNSIGEVAGATFLCRSSRRYTVMQK